MWSNEHICAKREKGPKYWPYVHECMYHTALMNYRKITDNRTRRTAVCVYGDGTYQVLSYEMTTGYNRTRGIACVLL